MRAQAVSRFPLVLAGLCGTFVSMPSFAMDETFKPGISGEISFEVQNDWAYHSDDKDTDVNTLTTTIEPYIVLSVTEHLAFETGLVLEQVQDPDPNDDTAFDNHGAYVEQLKVTYNRDNFGVEAGKFNPSFGVAWDLAPGVYGTDFAEDGYETAEKIGGGAHYTFEGEKTGAHTLTGNTYFSDTTFLSDSTITKRGELRESDGGVGNTEDFSSYSVTLDGENVAGVEGFGYHLGYRHQGAGDADPAGTNNENAYAVAAFHTFDITDSTQAFVLGEYVHIADSEGSDDNLNYLTTSLQLTFDEHWNIAGSYTNRDRDVAGGNDIDDYMAQLSAGYAFDNGIGVDLGWKIANEDGIDTETLGLLLTYGYEF